MASIEESGDQNLTQPRHGRDEIQNQTSFAETERGTSTRLWQYLHEGDSKGSIGQNSLDQALIHACTEANLQFVQLFLQKGANLHCVDPDLKTTPLGWACQSGAVSIVSFLLEKGARINEGRIDTQQTPLWIACFHGHLEIVSLLLQHGAEINQAENGEISPLWSACEKGYSEIASLLLQHGAEINQAKSDNENPLFIACQNGHLEIVSLLLQHGADINKAKGDSGATPLYTSCKSGHTEIVSFLLQQGADVDSICNERSEYLSKHATDHVDQREDAYPFTPIYAAWWWHGQTEVVSLLQKKTYLDLDIALASQNGHQKALAFFQSLQDHF